MADGFDEYRQGEKRPVYGSASAKSSSDTLTISGDPTCTLYDGDGAPVVDFVALDATDWDTDPETKVRVWYDLDTLTPVALAVGLYTLVFNFDTVGSDGLARTHEPSLRIAVTAPSA